MCICAIEANSSRFKTKTIPSLIIIPLGPETITIKFWKIHLNGPSGVKVPT